MSDFKFFFKEWREIRGLSQRQLGKMLDLSKVTISRIETGKRDFTGAFLKDFCVVVECKPWDVFLSAPSGEPAKWLPDSDRELEILEGAMAIKKRLRAQELSALVISKPTKRSARR